jgi:hypothetical protein
LPGTAAQIHPRDEDVLETIKALFGKGLRVRASEARAAVWPAALFLRAGLIFFWAAPRA